MIVVSFEGHSKKGPNRQDLALFYSRFQSIFNRYQSLISKIALVDPVALEKSYKERYGLWGLGNFAGELFCAPQTTPWPK